MQKPKNMWQFFGELFLILGALFLLFGLLSQAGFTKMRPGSLGSPYEFSIFGCVVLAVGAFSLLVSALKEKIKNSLLQTGISVPGIVVSVKQLSFTKWGTSNPYVIHFTYEWEGAQYRGKSGLLWILPPVREQDRVSVFIDEQNPKHCVLKQL